MAHGLLAIITDGEAFIAFTVTMIGIFVALVVIIAQR